MFLIVLSLVKNRKVPGDPLWFLITTHYVQEKPNLFPKCNSFGKNAFLVSSKTILLSKIMFFTCLSSQNGSGKLPVSL